MATKRENLMTLANIVAASDYEDKDTLTAFLTHEVELLDNKTAKSSASREARAIENASRMETVMSVLSAMDGPVSITDLQNASDELSAYSASRLSYLLSALVAQEKVIRTTDKKKVFFSIA